MKLTENLVRYIVAGIGLLIIIYAVLKSVLHFNVNENLEKNATTVLFVLAVAIFVFGRTLKNKQQDKTEK